MNKTILLSVVLSMLMLSSCVENNQNQADGDKNLSHSAMFDSNQSFGNNKALVNGLFSIAPVVDEETEVMFFNHGSSIGLLPQGVRPLKDDSSYVIISEVKNPNKTEFNSRAYPEGTRQVIVSAMDLVLDENHRLIKTYNNQNDIEEMVIVADSVTLSTNFTLFGTNLIIKANKIVFEDKGMINLSANPLVERPDQLQNGKNGTNGGNLSLLTETFILNGEVSQRIFLNGGKGQDAGLGKAGIPGKSMPPARAPNWNEPPANTVYVSIQNKTYGTKEWPGDGTDAVAGGVPGEAGHAGNLYLEYESSAEEDLLNKVFVAKGGLPGVDAPYVDGGAAGTPVDSEWWEWWYQRPRVISRHTSKAGVGAVRKTFLSNGRDGVRGFDLDLLTKSLKNANFQGALINQATIKLKYARALYMNFYIDSAHQEFSSLVNFGYLNIEPSEFKIFSRVELREIAKAAEVELAKISSHLDYFGNESTWFPALSFEINKAFNEKEIEASFSNLYYIYALRNSQSNVENKMRLLESLQKNIRQDIGNQQTSINDSLDKVPALQSQIAQIALKENLIQQELQMIETEIQRDAIRNLTPKKHSNALKIIAAVCTVFPAGQPALAIVGNAMVKVLEKKDEDRNWMEVIKEGYGIYNEIKNADWEASRNHWDENYGKLINESWKGLTPAQIQERLKAIYNAGKPIVDVIIAQKKAMNQQEAPRSAIEQEIVRIKNIHPRYAKIVQMLAELTEQKQLFSRSLGDLVTKVTNSREIVMGSFIQLSSMSSDYLTVSGNYNPDFSRSLSDLEERSKNNLLKYRYYFLKSYGYRFLKSPRVNYNPVAIFEKLVAMINYNKGGDLSKEQYLLLKQVFIQDLQPLMTDILNDIQMGTKVYAATTTLYFNKDEVERLTRGEAVNINLKMRDIYSESEEDIRISNMGISKFELTAPESINNPNLDLDLIQTGRFDLMKDGKSYAFDMSSNPSRWTYRYNMVDSTGTMIEIAKSFKALIASLLANFDQPIVENTSLEYFSLLGGKGELKVKFRPDSIRRLNGAALTNLAVKIDYVYTAKN